MKAVTLIVGDDEMLLSQAVKEAIGDSEVAIHRAEGSGLEASTISSLLSPELFADSKVVVITDGANLSKEALKKITKLAKYLDEKLRLIVTAGSKSVKLQQEAAAWDAKIVRTAKISNTREKVAFTREEAKKHGRRITDGAARKIIDSVEGDLRGIVGAIHQLSVENEGMLDEALVGKFYLGQPETTGFAVADAAVSGDPVAALEALRGALAGGTAPTLIAYALINQVRDMTRMRSFGRKNSNELAALLGMPAWKVEKLSRKLHGWSDPGLAEAFKAAIETDQAVQGQAANVSYALEKAVLSIALSKRR